jgi:hypothetical protein
VRPIDFPAGKLKTMAFDVSDLLNRDDPRIRLFSTLRLYWDSIRLATDADDAPLVTTALEPVSARLWQRGFSRSYPLLGAHDCEWFTWDELEAQPRWNQHPGLYTKLGETVPLVADVDDRFVILGAGDALTVRFDATRAPPLAPGWRRDFLVFLDGWAKDRDPNTLEALFVEPLPFHGMSGYPYRADEHYPDDEPHRAYRREWNTRPARRWIESIVPRLPSGGLGSAERADGASATSAMPASKNRPGQHDRQRDALAQHPHARGARHQRLKEDEGRHGRGRHARQREGVEQVGEERREDQRVGERGQRARVRGRRPGGLAPEQQGHGRQREPEHPCDHDQRREALQEPAREHQVDGVGEAVRDDQEVPERRTLAPVLGRALQAPARSRRAAPRRCPARAAAARARRPPGTRWRR